MSKRLSKMQIRGLWDCDKYFSVFWGGFFLKFYENIFFHFFWFVFFWGFGLESHRHKICPMAIFQALVFEENPNCPPDIIHARPGTWYNHRPSLIQLDGFITWNIFIPWPEIEPEEMRDKWFEVSDSNHSATDAPFHFIIQCCGFSITVFLSKYEWNLVIYKKK